MCCRRDMQFIFHNFLNDSAPVPKADFLKDGVSVCRSKLWNDKVLRA